MKINYIRERALEEAIRRINENSLSFARIEVLADAYTGASVQVAWPSGIAVDPFHAKDYAEELAWAADMTGALYKLDIAIDYSQDDEDLDDEEFDDLTSTIARALMDASWRQIQKALTE